MERSSQVVGVGEAAEDDLGVVEVEQGVAELLAPGVAGGGQRLEHDDRLDAGAAAGRQQLLEAWDRGDVDRFVEGEQQRWAQPAGVAAELAGDLDDRRGQGGADPGGLALMRLGAEHPDRPRRAQQLGRVERLADGDVAHAPDVRQPERFQRLEDLAGDAGLVAGVLGDGGFDLRGDRVHRLPRRSGR